MTVSGFSKAACLVVALMVHLLLVGPVLSATPGEVTANQVKEMLDNNQALIVFPLSHLEYDSLHIKGSINVPIQHLPADLPADKTQPIVFYCLGFT